MKESVGWQLIYTSPRMDSPIRHVALNTKFGPQVNEKMLSFALANNTIHLWSVDDTEEAQQNHRKVGKSLVRLSSGNNLRHVFSIGSRR